MSSNSIKISKGSNGIGTAGFILAFITFPLLGIFPDIGRESWLLALVFSAVGVSNAKIINSNLKLAQAGLIMSILNFILIILLEAIK